MFKMLAYAGIKGERTLIQLAFLYKNNPVQSAHNVLIHRPQTRIVLEKFVAEKRKLHEVYDSRDA